MGETKTVLKRLSNLLAPNMEHILDGVPPDIILQKIFQPYACLFKFFGILPLRMSRGLSFQLVSLPTLYTFICYSIFIFDSCLFVPMYIYLLEVKGSEGVTHAAQILFISCQYFGAVISYLLIPCTTPKLVHYFARINDIISQLSQLTSNREFVTTYVAARWKMRTWLFSSLSFTIFCVYSYGDGVEIYLGNEGRLVYWIYYSGFCVFPFMISFHILHSMIFTTMAITLKSSYAALTRYTEVESGRGNSSPKAHHLYTQINDLVVSLGEVYGIYVVLEIIIMITCITVNLFFFIAQFDSEANGVYVYAAVILPYFGWFHWICMTGETLRGQAHKCLKGIKRSAVKDVDDNLDWVILDDPAHLSASLYFNVNMKLFTRVIGTITTYLLVMLQFKVAQPLRTSTTNNTAIN